jgi:hypothetical protein
MRPEGEVGGEERRENTKVGQGVKVAVIVESIPFILTSMHIGVIGGCVLDYHASC